MKSYSIEYGTAEAASEVYDFLFPHGQIHPDLDKAAFMDCWRHQFFGLPSGPNCMLLARNGAGKLVGHYGIVPFPNVVEGRRLLGGFVCQLFVDPTYRMTALFFEMEKRILGEYKSRGFDFVYGLVTIKPVLAGHLRLGYLKGADLSIYAFPILPGRICTGAKIALPGFLKPPADRLGLCLASTTLFAGTLFRGRHPVKQIVNANLLDEKLLEQVQAAWPIAAERNRDCIRNRIASFGNKRYEIVAAIEGEEHRGYAILRRTTIQNFDALVVIDLLVPPGDAKTLHSLLWYACRNGLESRCDAVVCSSTPDAWYEPHLRSNMFFKSPAHFTLICGPQHRQMLSARWHLSWFDHDYV
jgi:hypothetical protein